MYKFISFSHWTIIFLLVFTVSSFSYEDNFEKRLNLWPFVVYSKNKIIKMERLEIAGPFIYKYSHPEENGTSYRPLYSSVTKKEEKKAFFLSPLGLYKSDNETTTLKLIPLINKKWEKTPEEKEEGRHFDFFPFFWGETVNNETYGGFFPIYGKFKNRFGKKEITFALWPIYSKVEYEDYVAFNYLWPFIRTIKDKNESDSYEYRGFKIWPLFGHFKEGERERRFTLWPFYIRDSFKDPEGSYFDKLIVFPFYVKEDTDTYNKKIILWPFFQKVYAKDYDYKQLDAPWPFYRKIEGENIKGRRYWPFYGYVKKSDSLDYFFLWPLYFYKETNIVQKNSKFYEKEYRFLVLSKYRYTLYTNHPTEKEYRIWPLVYDYEQKSNSTISINYFPAILPIYDEGLERNYGAFLKLWEYYRKNDYTFFKLLWGLYRYEKFKQRSVQELAFILRVVNGPNTSYVEILEGLIGLGKIDGRSRIRLFFLDLNRERDNEKK